MIKICNRFVHNVIVKVKLYIVNQISESKTLEIDIHFFYYYVKIVCFLTYKYSTVSLSKTGLFVSKILTLKIKKTIINKKHYILYKKCISYIKLNVI